MTYGADWELYRPESAHPENNRGSLWPLSQRQHVWKQKESGNIELCASAEYDTLLVPV